MYCDLKQKDCSGNGYFIQCRKAGTEETIKENCKLCMCRIECNCLVGNVLIGQSDKEPLELIEAEKRKNE